MESGNKGHRMANSRVMKTYIFKWTKIVFHLLGMSILSRCILYSSRGAKMSWDFSLLVRNLSEKQEQWGEFTLHWQEGQLLQQQISTAFHRGRNNDWIVKGMWIRCLMCSVYRLSSQNIHVLDAKLDCALLAVKITKLTCAVNCSQAERNVYKKHE
jgi:hypothetical protein